MIQGVATELVGQFANRLKAQLGPAPSAAGSAAAVPRPISGLSLLARVLWQSLRRLFRRAA
jgi:hypothetical protein